jgi:transcriptional regulator with GAF, ATPase, and Fis domain
VVGPEGPPTPVEARVTAVDPSLVSLALHVGRLTASRLDLPALLGRLCTALPGALGVAGAVIMVTEPSEDEPVVVASDAKAGWIGEAQRRGGPLAGVIRSGRPMLTPDLTRLGPPELAAAAAESGLTSSMAIPLTEGDERFGGLQLLGAARRPVEVAHADAVRPLIDVLIARLVDVRALRRLADAGAQRGLVGVPHASAVPAVEVDASDVATTAIPVVPPAVAVPAPRRPTTPARHRRTDPGPWRGPRPVHPS